ncbi:hypothetical protein [Paenibacillus sp. URB8-2]|uniref:hypothetical protein n=1 Tax=Paenibacillus sp. URB8-2 TaxID=2741301 RepID=UPI0015C00FC6|nr:hypothetical protein [Paenibacillus sp. URB8-2]BCG59882.1 hypothetical protein PUR_33070 [Paenibacillus sp. URB8-2]
MFQQMFAEMNVMLSDIARQLPEAQGIRRRELLSKYRMLRKLSDEALDEWLVFAEALSLFRQNAELAEEPEPEPLGGEASGVEMENFARGQGYYKLLMYPKCIEQFDIVISLYPDNLPARLYLAMSHLHLGKAGAAWEHLEHMLPLVQSRKLKAHLYNAMGCIAGSGRRFEEAKELFGLALKYDPAFPEPDANLEVCRRGRGELKIGSQLVSLL